MTETAGVNEREGPDIPESVDSSEGGGSKELVRVIKPIAFNQIEGRGVDPAIVAPRFYNRFNYAQVSRTVAERGLVIGITSAGRGEGKTLVASNLAVSLAIADRRKTVVVDLNLGAPTLHHAFKIPAGPGLLDSFRSQAIHLTRSSIERLAILTVGEDFEENANTGAGRPKRDARAKGGDSSFTSLEYVAMFRDTLYSLREAFDFVIVDLPSMRESNLPMILTNLVDGILIVVDSKSTRAEHLDSIFRQLKAERVLGFVLNNCEDQS